MSASNYVIQLSEGGLRKIEQDLGIDSNQARRLYAGGLKRALRSTRTVVRREVQEELTLKAKAINSRLSVKFGAGGGSVISGQLVAQEKRPPNLMSFAGTSYTKKRGIVARVRKTQGRQPVARRGFLIMGRRPGVADSNRGGLIAVQRRRIGGKRVGRLKLAGIPGPSPLGLLINVPKYGRNAQEHLEAEVLRNVDGAVRGFIDRRIRRG